MRKLVLFMNVTVDGCLGGPHGELDWLFPLLDEACVRWIGEFMRRFDTMLIGRGSYVDQAAYWPTQRSELATFMNTTEKIVFSKTLTRLDWSGSRLAEGDPADEVPRLKRLPGKDIVVRSGASLAHSLTRLGLIDEYNLLVHPVALGAGLKLFEQRLPLKLLDTRRFDTGAVHLRYQRG